MYFFLVAIGNIFFLTLIFFSNLDMMCQGVYFLVYPA